MRVWCTQVLIRPMKDSCTQLRACPICTIWNAIGSRLPIPWNPDIEEDIIDAEEDGDDDERRERQFFGDEEYTILSKVPEEEEVEAAMSMTMQ